MLKRFIEKPQNAFQNTVYGAFSFRFRFVFVANKTLLLPVALFELSCHDLNVMWRQLYIKSGMDDEL